MRGDASSAAANKSDFFIAMCFIRTSHWVALESIGFRMPDKEKLERSAGMVLLFSWVTRDTQKFTAAGSAMTRAKNLLATPA